jgi:hypothetical protein
LEDGGPTYNDDHHDRERCRGVSIQYALSSPITYTDYLGYFGFSSIKNFVSEHKATIASVAVGIAVGVAARTTVRAVHQEVARAARSVAARGRRALVE